MIESINNEKIKNYSKLNSKKYRDEMGLFLIEGEHLLEEAKKSGVLVDSFSLDGSIGTKVSEKVMKKLTNLTNVPNVIGVVKKIDSKKITGNILILDDIQDPGNLGTIIRSAVAFNINTIIASPNTVDLYNSKVIRSTEGMIFNINYVIDDILNVIDSIKDTYTIYTTDVKNGENIRNIKVSKPYAIIMGNEGLGVKDNISKCANIKVNIPINIESLNVGVATSIILYEFNK